MAAGSSTVIGSKNNKMETVFEDFCPAFWDDILEQIDKLEDDLFWQIRDEIYGGKPKKISEETRKVDDNATVPFQPSNGYRVVVFSTDDNKFYPNVVSAVENIYLRCIKWDDGESETLYMDHKVWRFILLHQLNQKQQHTLTWKDSSKMCWEFFNILGTHLLCLSGTIGNLLCYPKCIREKEKMFKTTVDMAPTDVILKSEILHHHMWYIKWRLMMVNFSS